MYALSEFNYIKSCLNVNWSRRLNEIWFIIPWEDRSFVTIKERFNVNSLQINNIFRHVLFINTPCSLSFIILNFFLHEDFRRNYGEFK